MNRLLGTLILITLLSCSQETSKSTIIPESLFSESENAQIDEMLNQFAIQVCGDKTTDVSSCLKEYFGKYWLNYKEGEFKTHLDRESIDSIMKPLSNDLESKLLVQDVTYIDHRIPNTNPQLIVKDTISHLSPNLKGTFYPILKEISKDYTFLGEVKEAIDKIQDKVSYTNYIVYSHWDKYDYDSNTDLLFLTLGVIADSDWILKSDASYQKSLSAYRK